MIQGRCLTAGDAERKGKEKSLRVRRMHYLQREIERARMTGCRVRCLSETGDPVAGIGISVEDQARIFQKFFRSDDMKAREVPGTGLGLNITKSLVEMQGGRIWFDSEYRQGTTFHFTVPVAEG